MPDWPADAVYVLAWSKVSAQMAASCAWRMVTKLTSTTFQAVNSLPLVGPVQYTTTLRRPLGAASGGGKTDDDQNTRTTAAFTGPSSFVRGIVNEFCAEGRRGIIWIGLWR